MCQEVRDEVKAVLGEDTDIKKYLLALCDDRLMPTPWLNKVCPFKPITIKITGLVQAATLTDGCLCAHVLTGEEQAEGKFWDMIQTSGNSCWLFVMAAP